MSNSKFADFDVTSPEGKTPADKTNILLRNVKTLRVGGTPPHGVLQLIAHMTHSIDVQIPNPEANVDVRNRHWKILMTTALKICEIRRIDVDDCVFNVGTSSVSGAVLADDGFRQLLTDTFQRHLLSTSAKSRNNEQKTRDYYQIVATVAALKLRKLNLRPWDEMLSVKEEDMIKKFDEMDMKDDHEAETHYQNENAVCYLGLMYHLCRYVILTSLSPDTLSIKQIREVCDGIFKYAHHKTHESIAKFITNLNNGLAYSVHGVDIKQGLLSLTGHSMFSDITSYDRDKSNTVITLLRLARMTSIVTGFPSLWNISVQFTDGHLANLLKLNASEKILQKDVVEEKKNMLSESIVWYLMLGKQKIMNPLTDDQAQNAEAIIGTTIGAKDIRAPRFRPGSMPFVKDLTAPDVLLYSINPV